MNTCGAERVGDARARRNHDTIQSRQIQCVPILESSAVVNMSVACALFGIDCLLSNLSRSVFSEALIEPHHGLDVALSEQLDIVVRVTSQLKLTSVQ